MLMTYWLGDNGMVISASLYSLRHEKEEKATNALRYGSNYNFAAYICKDHVLF